MLFDWVAALGRQRGALPRDPNVVYPEDAWMKCFYRVPVAPTPSSGASGQVIDGVLTVRAKDIGDVTWRELLSALAAYRLPSDIRALMILVQGRDPRPFCTIYLSADLLRAFLQLPLADRQSIMAAAGSGIVEAAQGAIARAVAAKTRGESQQPSPAQQSPSGGKLAPSSGVPYNQKRSPKVDKLLAFEGYPPGGNGLVALLIYLKINNDLGKKLFTHYVQESGSTYTLSVAEASALGAEPVSVDYIKGFTAKKDALVAQAKATGKSASGPISGNVDDTVDLPFTLGNFTVRFKGTLTATPDEKWSFNGTMHFVDEYDFDPKLLDPNSNRSVTGELKVILAWAFVSGKPFKIDSSFPATQTSADSSAKWAGTWGKASGGGEE